MPMTVTRRGVVKPIVDRDGKELKAGALTSGQAYSIIEEADRWRLADDLFAVHVDHICKRHEEALRAMIRDHSPKAAGLLERFDGASSDEERRVIFAKLKDALGSPKA